nr:ABC transporter ATP-binding protein [Corynebacterium phoceense]
MSFHVNRGELLCFLGPNGAGKTTTIEMCEGFAAPTSGSIRVLGLDPATNPDGVRERIGIMLQGGGSYSGIRVREMLELTARYSRNPLDPDWLIEILGLEGVAKNTYRRLSGGQQQRLSLALALIGRPELVFLDEPTAGMDAQSRLAVWELIRALKKDGVTIVLTTHLMDEAEALADRVIIIDHGRKVAEGTPAELMDDNRGAQLTFETDHEVDLAALPLKVVAQRPLHYALADAPTPATIAALTAALADQGVLLRRLDAAHATLEDVFLELTGRELRS